MDLGLYYFNARWYSAETGRFITEDPAKDGNNWYVYAVNNPLVFVDPSGLFPFPWIGFIFSETVMPNPANIFRPTIVNPFQNILPGSIVPPTTVAPILVPDTGTMDNPNKVPEIAEAPAYQNENTGETAEAGQEGKADTSDSTVDWENPPQSPDDLGEDWEDTTHPDKAKNTPDKEFTNKETGEKVEYHPNNSNGEPDPHWHRHNPNKTGKNDYYIDKEGKPVHRWSNESHLYPKSSTVAPKEKETDMWKPVKDFFKGLIFGFGTREVL